MAVTFVDGLVVARSTYNTDINYRSVVILGHAAEVKDLDEKRRGLERMVDHIVPGRSRDARPPTEKELRSTMLLRLPLDECSAKVRTGFPLDEEEDYDLEIWAGVIPLRTTIEAAQPDPDLRVAVAMPLLCRALPAPRHRRGVLTVCGVIGLLLRDPALEPELGSLLVPMLEALDERGPDSSGIALYADRPARTRLRAPHTADLARCRRSRRLGDGRLRAARRVPDRRRRAALRRRCRPRRARARARTGRGHPGRGVARGAHPRERLEPARAQGHRPALRHLRPLRRARLGGLPGHRPHPHGHRVGGHRAALPPLRPRP